MKGFEVTKTINLIEGTVEQKRAELKKYFLQTFRLEEDLYSLLKNDQAFFQKANPLRHPLIFYYGHTLTFYVNKLYIGKFINQRVNPALESQVAVGVDEMSWDDLGVERDDWPAVDIVANYRNQVKDLVTKYIDEIEFQMPINWESPLWPIIMGIEHQRIHIETSSVLIRELDLKLIKEKGEWPICTEAGAAPTNELLPVEGGLVTLGKNHNNAYYGWDNEYGQHQMLLGNFKASMFLVSNQEFMGFVQSEGYQNKEWWDEEGWKWRTYTKAEHPHFWIQRNGQYFLRVIDREITLPMNWPVEVNHLEAAAFCRWLSKKEKKKLRLPTEDEWQLLYQQEEVEHISQWKKAPGNINIEHFASSCPVDKFKAKNFYDVIGNVWQWTETPIYPFDGFKVHPLYDDFTVPTYDNKHNLFKGGSWISTGNEALAESRYAFRRHFFQHAGFRYVQSENPVIKDDNPYETDSLLSQYCEFHFGDSYYGVPNFPKACIDQTEKYIKTLPERKKALDLGCAVGRSTFELSKYFDEVIGLDFSARFISVAQKFMDNKVLRYTVATEGELVDFYERNFDDLGVDTSKKISFYQADACNLPEKYKDFDYIFCGNLIDRLHSPKSFLHTIEKHLKPGGILVLTSPYTWLEEYTPKSEWIGGVKRNGENVETIQGLREELAPWFEQMDEAFAIPFVIRETKRKFQHTLSEVSVWKKKASN